MEARRDVFQAIADPTRRQIIHSLAGQPQNLNSLSEQFDMSRQAVSLHIKILAECGLVQMKQQGRERICTAKLSALKEVHSWTEQYRAFWSGKLEALKMLVEHDLTPVKKSSKSSHSSTSKSKRK